MFPRELEGEAQVFEIDVEANKLRAIRNQAQWRESRERSLSMHGDDSIYTMLPEEGKRGLHAAAIQLQRAGLGQISTLGACDQVLLAGKLGRNKFGRIPTSNTMDLVELIWEKAVAIYKQRNFEGYGRHHN